MTNSRGAGLAWIAVAIFAFLIGMGFTIFALRPLNLWLHAGHYIPAELEITSFQPEPGDEGKGRFIEGNIQPGGEHVWTSNSVLSIKRFVDPADTSGRRVPTRSEIEGHHMTVWYWPNHALMEHWWQPPAVVMPGDTQKPGVGACLAVIGAAFLFACVYTFRRGFRLLAPSADSSSASH